VLIVLRTLTTFAWILELLPELLADARIQILFTVDEEGSAYRDGAVDALAGLGGRIVPWEQAVATPFSLAISASPNGKLARLRAPLLILPHGPGYSKRGSLPEDGVAPGRGAHGRARLADHAGPVQRGAVPSPAG
jgi:hypothetical protein